jgi:peptidoglycan/LPS O-acetylase OafA/YrhL
MDDPRRGMTPLPPTPRVEQARIDQLDSLRGLAAVSVVIWHWINVWLPPSVQGQQAAIFRAAWNRHDPRILGELGGPTLLLMSPLRILFSGYEAVILFFVLSGFVLSLPFWNGSKVDYKPYLVKRLFRIYVPYLAALALAVAGDAFLSSGGIPELNQWFNTTWHDPPDAANVLGNVFLIGSFSDSSFNTAFWSLVHEMRISLIFPFAMAALRATGEKARFFPLPVILLGAWLSIRLPGGRLCESLEVLGFFLVGACIAQSREKIVNNYRGWHLAGKCCFLVASISLFSFGWLWTFPAYSMGWGINYKDIWVCMGASGLIITALASPRASTFLTSQYPMALGRVSYSLYLVHATVLWGLIYLLYYRARPGVILTVYVATLMPVSYFFWRFIEAPSTRYGRRLGRANAAIPFKGLIVGAP